MEIGTDIALISDFVGKDESFFRRFLQQSEYAAFSSFKSEKRKAEYAAGRWAAKEAIYKATQDASFLKYEILSDAQGKPYVEGHPEIKVSISHDGGYAIAFVIRITE